MKHYIKWITAGAIIAAVILFRLEGVSRHRAAAQSSGERFTEREIVDRARSLCRLLLPGAGDVRIKAVYSDASPKRPGEMGVLKLWYATCTAPNDTAHSIVLYDAETGMIRLISVFNQTPADPHEDLPSLTPAKRARYAQQWIGDCDGRQDGDEWHLVSTRACQHHDYELNWQRADQCARVVVDGFTGQLVQYYMGMRSASRASDIAPYAPASAHR